MSLHSSFHNFLKTFHKEPDPSNFTPQENRQRLKDVFKKPEYSGELASINTEDRVVALIDVNLPIRIYRSKMSSSKSLIWIHGGGFVWGNIDGASDQICRIIAAKTNRTVISISYRLAPEYPFPTPPKDCFSVCEWILDHADELKIDPEQVTIGGASAGATLATTVCLMWRDKNKSHVFQHQLLIMPVIDSRMNYPSYDDYGKNHLLTTESMRYFLKHYTKDWDDLKHPYCLPINIEDFSNSPPATIAVAECDPLHDEGIHYAKLLKKSGIDVNLIDLEGVYHAFLGHLLENDFAKSALIKIINKYEKTKFDS